MKRTMSKRRALKIAGIGGSLRADSCSYMALEYVRGLLASMGRAPIASLMAPSREDIEMEIIDLRRMRLPFCNGDSRGQRRTYSGVNRLRNVVANANALVLVTPEYHGGMSGVLKNALDLLDPEHLEGKVVGAISVLGGPANSNALNDLERIMRWCHAWVIPRQIAVGHARTVFVDGQIVNPELRERFRQFAETLVSSAIRIGERYETELMPKAG